MHIFQHASAVLLAFSLAVPAAGQAQFAPPAFTYADLADLSLSAPVAAHVRVHRATALRPGDAQGVRSGHRRFYVEGDVVTLIRGAGGLPTRISYLVDLPDDARGRPARLQRKSEHLLLAATVPGRPGELRLVAPDAHLAWSPQTADRVRAILSDAYRADAPPRITGIGRAFHVPGSLPGESETQIFLQTAENRPVSLTVLRRPGQRPNWGIALSEIVDNAAGPPRADTLLWYRLACTLPRALPPQSLSEAGRAEAAAIQADYRFVLDALGPCQRNRTYR